MDDDLSLDPDRAAQCLVEMQNDIVHESNIGKRGVPVVYVNYCLRPGFLRPKTRLHRLSQREPMLSARNLMPLLATVASSVALLRTLSTGPVEEAS